VPAWGYHIPLFLHAGFDIEKYNYFSSSTLSADFASIKAALLSAEEHSIFVLQPCCHNPTGADYTKEQWTEIAEMMKSRKLFPFFDSAYQGFGSLAANGGIDDVWPIRYFASQGFDMVVCQSFSKNFGLYGERVGALHVVCSSTEIAANVLDQIRCLVRWEYSSPPGFGGRLVTLILSDEKMRAQWEHELGIAAAHVINMRDRLFNLLANELKTPGDWEFIRMGKGLFSYFPLHESQIKVIMSKFHIYFPFTGRINVAGLNEGNVERVAKAMDYVCRNVSV
jgi:aspartate aminotransferase